MKWRTVAFVAVLGGIATCPAALPAAAQTAAQTSAQTAASSSPSASAGQDGPVVPAAAPASAASGGFNGPTVTYPSSPPMDFAAGDVCPFPVHVTFPVSRFKEMTWTNDAGAPVYTAAMGKLTMRATNKLTGRSAFRDISGNGAFAYPDPTSFVLSGNAFVAFFHKGDKPSGQILVIGWDGFAAVRRSTVNGVTTKTLLALKGPHEDLCKTLAH